MTKAKTRTTQQTEAPESVDLGAMEPARMVVPEAVPTSVGWEDYESLGVHSRSGLYPEYATPESAAFDVRAHFEPGVKVTVASYSNQILQRTPGSSPDGLSITLAPNERALIPTGWFFDIPKGTCLEVFSRSGYSFKNGLILCNGVGIIDSDYVNELMVSVANISGRAVRIVSGDRIAQARLQVLNNVEIKKLTLKPTEKTTRSGGFGSTGVK